LDRKINNFIISIHTKKLPHCGTHKTAKLLLPPFLLHIKLNYYLE